MAAEQQARFTHGELVQYRGTVRQVHAWLFEVSAVRTYTGRQPHYDLIDPVWKLRLFGVRESSLRGPNDAPQTAATVTDGVAPPTSTTAGR